MVPNVGKSSCLITGSSGFLGSVLVQFLSTDFEITTLGRNTTNDVVIDLSKEIPTLPDKFNLIIHNAGKAHSIPKTTQEIQAFWDTNHQGTLRLLQAIDNAGHFPLSFVFISTVAVYGIEEGENISESAPLEAQTPYAQSKLAAEKAIWDWGLQRGVPVVILRLPLVVGPNPPGNLAKMGAAIQKGRYVRIQNNLARKSAVNARDVAKLIPTLLGKSGIYNLTDGVHPTFESIESAVAQALKKPLRWSIPKGFLRLLAGLGDSLAAVPLNTATLPKLTASLSFSDAKARAELGWNPSPVLPVLADPNTWSGLFALDTDL
ncbi:MAG: NAD-dependent epimerase/dehydratase family protein [Phycisphaerae bacterium]|nr:NAD-dependent epimerase/dehydratase family protein [Saprospiraceae bacterium]